MDACTSRGGISAMPSLFPCSRAPGLSVWVNKSRLPYPNKHRVPYASRPPRPMQLTFCSMFRARHDTQRVSYPTKRHHTSPARRYRHMHRHHHGHLSVSFWRRKRSTPCARPSTRASSCSRWPLSLSTATPVSRYAQRNGNTRRDPGIVPIYGRTLCEPLNAAASRT